MLLLEAHRQSARTETTPSTALVAPSPPTSDSSEWVDHNKIEALLLPVVALNTTTIVATTTVTAIVKVVTTILALEIRVVASLAHPLISVLLHITRPLMGHLHPIRSGLLHRAPFLHNPVGLARGIHTHVLVHPLLGLFTTVLPEWVKPTLPQLLIGIRRH